MEYYIIPALPLSYDLETKEILKQVNRATRKLAELKGVAQTIPNEQILISSLTLQEARDSSMVESIVTTHDELYRAELDPNIPPFNAATKEVLHYREAITTGFRLVREESPFICFPPVSVNASLSCFPASSSVGAIRAFYK